MNNECPYCHFSKEWTDLVKTKYVDGSYIKVNIIPFTNHKSVIFVEHMKKTKYGETGSATYFMINYCPICGRKMSNEL